MTTLLYGAWAAICFLLVASIVTWEFDRAFLPVALTVFVLASLGWWLWHRGGRQPSGAGYALLAIVITLTTNFAFIALMLTNTPNGLDKFIQLALFSFALHGWFTIPIALLATWAFVRWSRR